jgi:hypothetical protein
VLFQEAEDAGIFLFSRCRDLISSEYAGTFFYTEGAGIFFAQKMQAPCELRRCKGGGHARAQLGQLEEEHEQESGLVPCYILQSNSNGCFTACRWIVSRLHCSVLKARSVLACAFVHLLGTGCNLGVRPLQGVSEGFTQITFTQRKIHTSKVHTSRVHTERVQTEKTG